MNKHSIDDFFAERLSNHEIKPSSRAFEMFEDKISEKESKKKGVFWILPGLNLYYYGAAACILLLIGFFWFQPESEKNTFANNSKTGSEQIANLDPKSLGDKGIESIMKDNQNDDFVISESLSNLNSNKRKLLPKIKGSVPVIQNDLKTTNPIAHLEIDEPIKDNLYLALDNNKSIAQNSGTIKSSNIFSNDIGETLVVISAIDTPEERVSIPSVNSDSDLTIAEAKSYQNKTNSESNEGIFAKVFTEIKHLKHGEKVDVNEIMSDFNLNEESFIVSETRQIKEKWSQIKNILARN